MLLIATRLVMKSGAQVHHYAWIMLCVIIQIVFIKDIFAAAKKVTRAILISVLDAQILMSVQIPTSMTAIQRMENATILEEVLAVLVILITMAMENFLQMEKGAPHNSQ